MHHFPRNFAKRSAQNHCAIFFCQNHRPTPSNSLHTVRTSAKTLPASCTHPPHPALPDEILHVVNHQGLINSPTGDEEQKVTYKRQLIQTDCQS